MMAVQNEGEVSGRTSRVANELFWTMLPSTSLLVAGKRLSEDQVKRGVRDLRKNGFVKIEELGCLLPAVPLVRWTESGLDQFEATEVERSWFGADGLGSFVLYDFAKLEAVNSIAPFYATKGWALHHIHFYERQPMFSVAEYVHWDHQDAAYVVFCWVSMMDTQRELCEKLEALPEAMRLQSRFPIKKFEPAGIALVAAGEWGASRALCMARAVLVDLSDWISPRRIAGWHYGRGGWYVSDADSALSGLPPQGMPPLLELEERPREELLRLRILLRPSSMSIRKLGSQKIETVLARSLFAGRGGHTLILLLTLVAIFPCGSLAHYQSLMGEQPGGKDTKKRLRALEKLGLIEVVRKYGRAKRPRKWSKEIPFILSERGQGAHRYAATQSGRVHFCYIHGGRPEDLFRRTKLGRRHTVVREKAPLDLLTLSWVVSSLYAGGTPVDLRVLAKMARTWNKVRTGALVHLLALSCMVSVFYAPGEMRARALSMAKVDRIWTQIREGIAEDRWLYQHEDIVYEIFGQLRQAGCSFAPGWQARTTLNDEGIKKRRIDPDGMILVETPWGRTWCYLEVELSDRTFKAVYPRCQKYGSRNRRDNCPVFVVCRDEQAERNFHRAASTSEFLRRLLTTTLTRLKAGGFFGPGVWSHYGRPEIVAP